MKTKQQLSIEIVPNYDSIYHEKNSEYGKITIDKYYEHFYMSPQVWTMEQYQQQWKLALERIKTHDHSLFIQNIQLTPFIFFWPINKDTTSKKLFIYTSLLIEEDYKKIIGNKKLTPHNIFDIIPPCKPGFDFYGKRINQEPSTIELERLIAESSPDEWYVDYED